MYTSENRSTTCQECFDTWCWAGDDNTTQPAEYEPVINSVPPWLIANNLSLGVADAPASNESTPGTASSGAAKIGVSVGMVALAAGLGLMF